MKHWSNTGFLSVILVILFALAACSPAATDDNTINDEVPPPVDNNPSESSDPADDELEDVDGGLEADTNENVTEAQSVTDEDRGVTLIVQDAFVDEENSLNLVVAFASADGEAREVSFTEDEFVLVDSEGVQNMPVTSDGSLSDVSLSETASDPVTLEYSVLEPSMTFVLQVPGFDGVTIDAPADMQEGDEVPQPIIPDTGQTRDGESNSETTTND